MSHADLSSALTREFLARRPDAAANHIETLSTEAALQLLTPLPAELVTPVWEALLPNVGRNLLLAAEPALARKVLNRMQPPRAVALLSGMEEEEREGLLAQVTDFARRDLLRLLEFPPDSAGALMDPRVLVMRPELSVADALERLRRESRRRRAVRGRRVLYAVDEEHRLLGSVDLQELALAPLDTPLAALLEPIAGVVNALDDKDDIVAALSSHDQSSLPVVDNDGHLIGVVREDQLLRTAREQAVTDLQTLFGASADERALSPVVFTVAKRLPWLQINLLTAFLAAAVVGLFEDTIARFTALAVLLPVVAGQSGNTGAQALAVVIRGLALREIRLLQWPAILRKELFVGLINGLGVSATTCLGVYLWSGSAGLTLVIGLSMVASMLIAGIAGAGVPLLLTLFRLDPAQSSSIVLTTVTDVAGFFSFLGIATLLADLLPAG
ncbi:MAG: magnesium transporter [Gammaproteobacteria bacterium]|nr:magnesium transporter [Gammaproteobacteria bacterium]